MHYGLRAHGFTFRAVRTARLNQPPSHWIEIVLKQFDKDVKLFQDDTTIKEIALFCGDY